MRLTLRNLILFIALLSVILTLFSSLSTGYRIEKETLMKNTLETNRVYAKKLANTTDTYLQMMLQTLQVSSNEIASFWQSNYFEEKLLEEANRLKNQTNTFNSVMIAGADGKILATSPQQLNVRGDMLDSPGGKEALEKKKTLISEPYLSITGRLIIFISQPIFDVDGNYLGLVGGSIYLKEENILKDLLGEHYYEDGSYVYVVDEKGRIIYHQRSERINDQADKNPVVKKMMQGINSGAERVVNTKNVDMLAGYARVPVTNWGIVSQRPTANALAPSQEMITEMIVKSLPFLLLSTVIIWLISELIIYPLRRLSRYVELSTEMDEKENIEKIKAWYYEAIQLKKALTFSLSFLHKKVDHFIHQSTTDPLTKLLNRRTMDDYMEKWAEEETSFSIILLDIDHFKCVNDTYGHSMGDEVLIFLADQIRNVSRKQDRCYRFGGEEFILMLPNTTKEEAFEMAERLRQLVEATVSPTGKSLTISAGIASSQTNTKKISSVIELADQALYKAKESGRNKCVIFQEK